MNKTKIVKMHPRKKSCFLDKNFSQDETNFIFYISHISFLFHLYLLIFFATVHVRCYIQYFISWCRKKKRKKPKNCNNSAAKVHEEKILHYNNIHKYYYNAIFFFHEIRLNFARIFYEQG